MWSYVTAQPEASCKATIRTPPHPPQTLLRPQLTPHIIENSHKHAEIKLLTVTSWTVVGYKSNSLGKLRMHLADSRGRMHGVL